MEQRTYPYHAEPRSNVWGITAANGTQYCFSEQEPTLSNIREACKLVKGIASRLNEKDGHPVKIWVGDKVWVSFFEAVLAQGCFPHLSLEVL